MSEFKVGDVIDSPYWGKGVVIEGENNGLNMVKVKFESTKMIVCFKTDGSFIQYATDTPKQELYITKLFKRFGFKYCMLVFWAIILMGYLSLDVILPMLAILVLIGISLDLVELAINNTKPNKKE